MARDYLGRPHVAKWVAADLLTGLTLLRVAPRAVRPIRAAKEGPKLGSQVFVVGNPFGLGHSVNRGVVAGLDRVLELGRKQLGGLIQVQVPLYPGDSGAAVVDFRGRWLGVIRGGLAIPGADARASDPGENAATPAPARPAEGGGDLANANANDAGDLEPDSDFGFAIPTRDALWVANQLRTHGRVDRAYLGVVLAKMPVSDSPIADPEPARPAPAPDSSSAPASEGVGSWRGAGGGPGSSTVTTTDPAPAAEADMPPVPGEGARILELKPDTPAALAGLRPGDRIVALDGQLIRSRNDLIDKLNCIAARTTIVLGVVRDGEPAGSRLELRVQTASHPGRPPAAVDPAPATPAEPRSDRASVAVTPTAARVEPAASGSISGGPNPSAPAAAPSSTPRREAAPGPTASAADHAETIPSASGPPSSLNELKLSLPRAFVERIEHLERRLNDLEHSRGGPEARAGGTDEREPRAQTAAAANHERERAVRPSGPSTP